MAVVFLSASFLEWLYKVHVGTVGNRLFQWFSQSFRKCSGFLRFGQYIGLSWSLVNGSVEFGRGLFKVRHTVDGQNPA